MRNEWFETETVDSATFRISEPQHSEETNCWLLVGEERALLFDSGLGVADMAGEIAKLTDKPVTVLASHVHWDHIGSHGSFEKFFVHEAERKWIEEAFPISRDDVLRELAKGQLPGDFEESHYEIFCGKAHKLLRDGDMLQLGERSFKVIHTPGHSPGHICLWEAERGWLFTGDIVYKGCIYADFPSTEPEALLRSLEKLSSLPVKRIFPGHHDREIKPDIIQEMCFELRKLQRGGKLRHGGGSFRFGDWGIKL